LQLFEKSFFTMFVPLPSRIGLEPSSSSPLV
jgi:hypothetical protein